MNDLRAKLKEAGLVGTFGPPLSFREAELSSRYCAVGTLLGECDPLLLFNPPAPTPTPTRSSSPTMTPTPHGGI